MDKIIQIIQAPDNLYSEFYEDRKQIVAFGLIENNNKKREIVPFEMTHTGKVKRIKEGSKIFKVPIQVRNYY